MRSPLRVLIVGAGSISREYALNHFTPSETNCVVAGVVDANLRKAENLASDVGRALGGAEIVADGGNKYRSRVAGGRNADQAVVKVPSFSSLDDALSSNAAAKDGIDDFGIDVVYIGTPPGSHRSLAEAALASGKHVLLEKPLASTPEDADAIVSAATDAHRTHGAVVAMDIGMRYNAALVEMRRRLLGTRDAEAAGGGFCSTAEMCEGALEGELRLHFWRWPRKWQTQPWCAGRAEGGPLREVGTHFLAALLEFSRGDTGEENDQSHSGVPLSARVRAEVTFPSPGEKPSGVPGGPCERSATGTIELQGGALPPGGLSVQFSVLTDKGSLDRRRDIYELTIKQKEEHGVAARALTLFDFTSLRDNETGAVLVQKADYGRKECVKALVDAVASSGSKGESNSFGDIVTVEDGRNAQRLLDAIFLSEGEWVQVGLIPAKPA